MKTVATLARNPSEPRSRHGYSLSISTLRSEDHPVRQARRHVLARTAQADDVFVVAAAVVALRRGIDGKLGESGSTTRRGRGVSACGIWGLGGAHLEYACCGSHVS